MDLKKLFNDNKAVSPVVGVVLMVAITVILAAAIGSSVFNQGNVESAPQANIDITAVNSTNGGYIKFEHLGGDPINFASNTTTKISASLNGGTSVEIVATGLKTLEVGSMETIKLNKFGNSPAFSTLKAGDTVNIKIIDVRTQQLITDKNVRF
ncbi:MAG: type IV pilin [Euryarchaeota archaeon]|nr:type IV pilin [Euryarchaeota archaeon]